MLVMTIEGVGRDFVPLGLVRGSFIRRASIRYMQDRELENHTQMMEESREMALQRMVKQAELLGADAVIGVRFTSRSVTQWVSEVTAYGTAIRYS